ncbi:MAG: Cas8a1 family CRISPR/Cas system-associated protein [Clostridia bacterium]|nr:Cas8a1 family CRISPR/Cas system-associated protein [Clostridia bacterium]
MENAIKVESGSSFFLSAGICGVMTFLEKNKAVQGIDYEVEDQCLYISIDYIKNNNIPEMYVSTMADALGENTKFYRIVNDRYIDNAYKKGVQNLDKDEQKTLSDKYSEFIGKFSQSRYLSAYKLLEQKDGVQTVTEAMITDLKKCDDADLKYQKYKNIVSLLNQPEVKKTLIYTELIYTNFKLFFAENSQSKKISCLCKSEQNYEKTYDDNFFSPLLEELKIEDKKKTACCIECRRNVSPKFKKAFTFLSDTADDVNRKKSYYWFCKSDAFVCPVCAFIYSFIPLGFAFMGSDAVFINNNSSIKDLQRVMNTCKAKTEDENGSVRRRVLRTLTSEKIDALNNVMSNIQVIMNSSDYSHFKFEVIDKDMVMKLQKGKKYLSYFENKKICFEKQDKKPVSTKGKNKVLKEDKKSVSVYDLVLDYIYEKRDLYYLLDKLLRTEIDKNGNINYLKGLLRLAIIFNGGAEMDNLNEKVNLAFLAGNNLRKAILGNDADKSDSEDDNRLRGFVYRLVNLSSVGDREQFMDTVVRIYSGFSLTMPSIFKDCYISDEMFKAIAHGFILGLKYVPYKKDNKEDVNNG